MPDDARIVAAALELGGDVAVADLDHAARKATVPDHMVVLHGRMGKKERAQALKALNNLAPESPRVLWPLAD